MSENHSLDPKVICKAFLDEEEQKKVGWYSKILFPDTKLILSNRPKEMIDILRQTNVSVKDGKSDSFDLLECANKRYRAYKHVRIVYFDNEKYNPLGGFKGEGFKKLIVSLRTFIQNNCGFGIYLNGGDGSKTGCHTKIVRCLCGRKYRGDVDKAQCVTESFRKHTLHHDRINGRGTEGRSLIRAGKTKKPIKIHVILNLLLVMTILIQMGFYSYIIW